MAGGTASSEEAYSEFVAGLRELEEEQAEWFHTQKRWRDIGGWYTTRGGGCVGLVNIGNTCWLNAGLQCLMHLRPVCEHLMESDTDRCAGGGSTGSTARPVASVSAQGSDGPRMAEALRELLVKLWQVPNPRHAAEHPGNLHGQLRHYAPWLVRRFRQQDGQEFLAYMLDALHNELQVKQDAPEAPRKGSKEPLRLLDIEQSQEELKAAWAWALHLREMQSPIVDIFQGQLRSALACGECGFVSQTFDPFLHLSVPVKPGASLVSESLEAFSMEEHLTDGDRWLCERCDKKVNATKRMELYKLPPAIMLHLKRFRYDDLSRSVKKVAGEVSLPEESLTVPLDLAPYAVSRQKGQALYDIVGIVNHHGSEAECGHYTAHCRHCIDDLWYRFDDDKVSEISEQEAWLPEAAYVLFLMKRRPEASDEPVRSVSQVFTRHVSVHVQSPEEPEHWPHLCDLVGIRRQLQLFNYMPSEIDQDKFAQYRIDYQRFRQGGHHGAVGSFSEAPSKTCGAVAPSGRELGPAFARLPYTVEELDNIRTEYQRWRIAGLDAAQRTARGQLLQASPRGSRVTTFGSGGPVALTGLPVGSDVQAWGRRISPGSSPG